MNMLSTSFKIYIANSKIKNAGRGVFASENINKNGIIEICPVILAPKSDLSNLNESIFVTYFFYFGKDKDQLAIALGFGSIYNHSYTPNTKYKINIKKQTIIFTALENIKKDDEITFNYKQGNPKNKNPLWFEVNS